MAARAYWKGQIRLALVSIPVEIYSATKSGATIAFNQIHEPSGKRIKYEKVVPGIGPVDADEIVKGFQYAKDSYVLLDDEEIEAVKLESKKTLELTQFVDHDEIDVLYYEKPYYVVPADDLAEDAFIVLREALKRTVPGRSLAAIPLESPRTATHDEGSTQDRVDCPRGGSPRRPSGGRSPRPVGLRAAARVREPLRPPAEDRPRGGLHRGAAGWGMAARAAAARRRGVDRGRVGRQPGAGRAAVGVPFGDGSRRPAAGGSRPARSHMVVWNRTVFLPDFLLDLE